MSRPSPLRTIASALVVSLLVLVAGCGADADTASSTTTATPTTDGAPTTTSALTTTIAVPGGSTPQYLSLGDSYAQGFQPEVEGASPAYTDGFAYLVPDLAAAHGWDLELVNLGCGGATVGSMASADGCSVGARSPGGPTYEDRSQLEAAVAHLEANPGVVELITVSIGGNDVTVCATVPDPIGCVADAVARIDSELGPVLTELREAAGPDATIIGLTYPNVILGTYLDEATRPLAGLSVVAFEEFINPTLERSYSAIDAQFLDVTAATDGYVPFEETTTVPGHGEVPVAVATVCELTWFCENQDIHPTSDGHRRIAELIVEALPER